MARDEDGNTGPTQANNLGKVNTSIHQLAVLIRLNSGFEAVKCSF